MQIANVQINYDIPWSPLKLEQRLGRLHRYGQKRTVYLFNLYVESTLDEKIVNELIYKLQQISRNLGDWIFDYVGNLITTKDILSILDGNNVNIDEKRLNVVTNSLASPGNANFSNIFKYISQYQYKVSNGLNIQYILSNIKSIIRSCQSF